MRKVKIESSSFFGFNYSYCARVPLLQKIPQALKKNGDKSNHFWVKQFLSGKEKRQGIRSLTNDDNKMDGDCNYSDVFPSEEYSRRRLSTFEDVQLAISLLKEIIEYRNKKVSSWIIESKVKKLCGFYKCFLKSHKNEFIQVLARDYSVNHKKIFQSSEMLASYSKFSEQEAKLDVKVLKSEDQLRTLLTPEYSWLFLHIGKLEKGVKFLVDLRTDVLDFMAAKTTEAESITELQQLNTTLRDLLSLWFSVGFLQLQRVTWSSSCEMLEKISEYEAVHPVRSWTDLKRRVGQYRRCFVFLHGSMPGEAIVVLHTALCDEIASSMAGIVSARSRMSNNYSLNKKELCDPQEEDPTCIKAAVFYSITSTQKGLQGIELGNYLIKCVVHELQIEFPQMNQFSSLSPIPKFKSWLIEKFKSAEKGPNDALLQEEIENLTMHMNSTDFWQDLKKLVLKNSWLEDKQLFSLLEKPLMRLCARYLFLEKHRGYAFDSVANFHLRNGAVLWRLNWSADLSPRGLGNSCSIMVNYRYFLEDTECNSKAYLENQTISASKQILKLAEQAQKLMVVSKM